MKSIIAFIIGTAAVLAVAVGWQTFGTSSGEENKEPRPPAVSTGTPRADISDGSSASPDATSAPSGGNAADKSDDGERDGFTQDHSGKPGENKN